MNNIKSKAKELWLSVLANTDLNPKYLDKVAEYCLMHASLESYLSGSLSENKSSTIFPSIRVLTKLGEYLDKIEFVEMPNFVKNEEKYYSVGTYAVSVLADKNDITDLITMHGMSLDKTTEEFYENLSEAVANQYKKIIDEKGAIYVYLVVSDIRVAPSQKDVPDNMIKYFSASRLVAQSAYSVPTTS